MNNKSKNFLKGIRDSSPLMIPVVPFGVIFGVLAIEMGLTPLTTIAMSVIIFGGASQIIFLQLLSAGASSLVILSSVGAVNATLTCALPAEAVTAVGGSGASNPSVPIKPPLRIAIIMNNP